MAPSKAGDATVQLQKTTVLKSVSNNKMTTRLSSRASATANMLKKMNLKDLTKRKADQLSPPKGKTTKRSAFCDLTNATSGNTTNTVITKEVVQKKPVNTVVTAIRKETVKLTIGVEPKLPTVMRIPKPAVKTNACNKENVQPLGKPKTLVKNSGNQLLRIPVKTDPKPKEVKTSKPIEPLTKQNEVKVKEVEIKPKETKCKDLKTKESSDKVKSSGKSLEGSTGKSLTDDSSLYASALDMIDPEESLLIISPVRKEKKIRSSIPVGVADFDKECWDDPCQVSEYAMDIFKYLKSREGLYCVGDYLPRQTTLNKWMRAVLVDWMIDVQEHFELCHETLYLAVKVMDLYLDNEPVMKESLQLVGVASLFVASKYDERIPPSIEEFLYMCENTYTRDELVRMEIELFKGVNFCLGMPLSYRFLRRYARCSKTTMPVLTLARYILELSLMEYPFVFASESKIACACLYLALVMKGISKWTATLEYYSGYKKDDFFDLCIQLNAMLHRKPKEQLKTVRNKYSHSVFFEVAKTPLIESSLL